MNILEYSKMILLKVSFDKELLKKELRKAIRNISLEDRPALLEWFRRELLEKMPSNNFEHATVQPVLPSHHPAAGKKPIF